MDEYEALALAAAARKRQVAQQPNPDGTYGLPPEGMILNLQTGQMTSRELMTNALPTSRGGAAASGFMQGFSMDTVDEAAGAGGDFYREKARAQVDANAQDYPGTEMAGRVAGAILSPVNKIMKPVQGVKGALSAGATYGGIEGFFSGEGGATERLKSAGWGAGSGALFGGMTERLGRGVHKAVTAAFRRADKRPTVDALAAAKNSAYAAVRRSGHEFSQDDLVGLWSRVDDLAKDPRWDLDSLNDLDGPAFAALRTLQRRAEAGPITLNNLDKTRQKLWDIYGQKDHPFILQAIEEIDGLIAKNAEGNELLAAARDANAKYAKAQLLENAFKKARLQTASTGSGGNILNKYRQAVTRIITTPREAKWFSQEELALMESFVEGDTAENVFRRAGKLAPGGNGLMLALNFYAANIDPSLLAVTAAAQAAKSAADKSAITGKEAVLDAVSTGVIASPRPKPDLKPLAVGGASLGTGLVR